MFNKIFYKSVNENTFILVFEQTNSKSKAKPMSGVLLDAGGEMAKVVMPEKVKVFKRSATDKLIYRDTNEATLWDENNKLVPEAKMYSDSKSILKINHPLMIMVKEKRVVSNIHVVYYT